MSEHVWLPSFGFPFESNEASESLSVQSTANSNGYFWGLKEHVEDFTKYAKRYIQEASVITTMALHNYIRRYSQNHDHFDEIMDESSHSISESY